jgi:hypothetical protein
MEGFAVTCPLAPDVPRLISGFCSSPRSFGFGFLQTPPRGDALAVSLAFGSAKTWLPDFHRHSYVPCPAHTFEPSCGEAVCLGRFVMRYVQVHCALTRPIYAGRPAILHILF